MPRTALVMGVGVGVVVGAFGLMSCTHDQPRPRGAARERCSVRDPVACAIECDEGVDSACEMARDLAPHMFNAAGTVAAAELDAACAAGHATACARVALAMADAGDVEGAYALVEPHCTDRTFFVCDVAAGIGARRPLPSGPFAPVEHHRLIRVPKPTRIPQAYPRFAAVNREEGTTVLAVGVRRDGSVASIRIIQSAGTVFDEHAMFAARRRPWRPARNTYGWPVDSETTLTVRFQYDPPRPPPPKTGMTPPQ